MWCPCDHVVAVQIGENSESLDDALLQPCKKTHTAGVASFLVTVHCQRASQHALGDRKTLEMQRIKKRTAPKPQKTVLQRECKKHLETLKMKYLENDHWARADKDLVQQHFTKMHRTTVIFKIVQQQYNVFHLRQAWKSLQSQCWIKISKWGTQRITQTGTTRMNRCTWSRKTDHRS